jgi:hypothetical protein
MPENQLVDDATVARVAKSIVDIGLPGFSLYMDRDFSDGLVHTVAGLGAGIVLGPLGMWLVAANSISRSSSGKNLWERGPFHSEQGEQGEHRQPREHRKESTRSA